MRLMVGAAILVGLAGALEAVLFRLLIRAVQAFAFEGPDAVALLIDEEIAAEAHDPLEAARHLAWLGAAA